MKVPFLSIFLLLGYSFQDPSELLQFVKKDQFDQKFHCTICGKFSHKNSYCTRNHVESQHFPETFSYPCDQCEMIFTTKSNFSLHRSRKHKQDKMHQYWKIKKVLNYICFILHFKMPIQMLLDWFILFKYPLNFIIIRLFISRTKWAPPICEEGSRWPQVPLHSLHWHPLLSQEQLQHPEPCGITAFPKDVHLSMWKMWHDIFNKQCILIAQVKEAQRHQGAKLSHVLDWYYLTNKLWLLWIQFPLLSIKFFFYILRSLYVNSVLGYNFQDPSELLQFVKKDSFDQKFYCTVCGKFSHKIGACTRNHVESQHFPNVFSYPCDQCDMTFGTKTTFNLHRSRKHNPKNR